MLGVGVGLGGLQIHAESNTVPDWVKKSAGWWADGTLGDSEFIGAVQYMINEDIIVIGDPGPTCADIDYMIMDGLALHGAGLTLSFTNDKQYLKFVSSEASENFKKSSDMIFDNTDFYGQCDNFKLLSTHMDVTEKVTEFLYETDTNIDCVLFCDSAGYEPNWAKSMGEHQAQSKCLNVIVGEFGTSDYNWCNEFNGYLLDKMR